MSPVHHAFASVLSWTWYKCTVMHIGPGNKKFSYQLGNSVLESTDTQKDLGIWISNDLKFEFHMLEACKKANKMLG